MKAAVFQGPGLGHRVESVADPDPRPAEVVVEVHRSGVCGSDVSLTGERDAPTLLGPDFERAFGAGAVLGHEVCGTVVELGADVTGFRLGDRLAPMFFTGCASCDACRSGLPQLCSQMSFPMGGYAQYARLHPAFCAVLPPGLPSTYGAWVEPLATSLHVTESSGISGGDRVLVLGAGALGLGVIHFARRSGASAVVAVARTPAKTEVARRLGADHLVVNNGPSLAELVADLLGGPPDVVVEAAGIPGLVDTAIACVRPWGRVTVAGMCLWPESTSHAIAEFKNLTIRYTSAYTRAHFAEVVEMLVENPIELPEQVTGIGGFPAAFEALRDDSTVVKLQLDPWAE